MRTLTKIGLLSILAVFASCATNNDVVSNRLIQKRKYQKGYYFEKNQKAIESASKVTVKGENHPNNSSNLAETCEAKDTFEPKKVNSNFLGNETNIEILESRKTLETDQKTSLTKSQFSNGNRPMEVEKKKVSKIKMMPLKKSLSKKINQKTSKKSVDTSDPVILVLLIILALILPPLAIFLYSGVGKWFWIDLLLFILGISGLLVLGTLAGIAVLTSVIIALLVIFDII